MSLNTGLYAMSSAGSEYILYLKFFLKMRIQTIWLLEQMNKNQEKTVCISCRVKRCIFFFVYYINYENVWQMFDILLFIR